MVPVFVSRESWVVYLASLIYVHIFKNNNILFILDVSDLSMDICKETALLRQLLMILFAFYLPIHINNNTQVHPVECSQDTILLNICVT
jgi:hypothetical protein